MPVPERVATRPLAPIAASGEPIRHVSLTISSQAGPVYLDVWAPTTAPPPIPGARAPGYSHYPGRGRQSHDATARQYHRITGALWVGGDDNDHELIERFRALSGRWRCHRACVPDLATLAWSWSNPRGHIGPSAGNAPASLAAADPRIRHLVAFLMSFGGFYNVRDLMADVGRRALIVNGHLEKWVPNDVPLHVLANTIGGTLPQSDGSKRTAAFGNNHPTPLTPDQVAHLSSPAAAAYHILAGDQPGQVERNLSMPS